jgi:hypothetical protein
LARKKADQMKQILLASALVLAPVGLFAGFQIVAPYTAAATMPSFSEEMSAFGTIIAETQKTAATGDFNAAEKRATDFETAWDNAEEKLRPLDKNAWGNIDEAADKAFRALRKSTPDAQSIDEALTALAAVLATGGQPVDGTEKTPTGMSKVSGIAVTDDNGHPIPCEVMLNSLSNAIAANKFSVASLEGANALRTKALERCNADDDMHADEFTAEALALTGK